MNEINLGSEKGEIIGYAGEYCIQALNSPALIKDDWELLQCEKTAFIYQNYEWVRIACETIEKNNTIFIVTGRVNDKLQFILPMAFEEGIVKTVKWIGGTHANICSGIFSEAFLKTGAPSVIPEVFKLIKKSIGGAVKTQLHNQPFILKSYKNPMLALPHQASINSMYDMDLSDGLDAILDHGNGKRKRKSWRKQNRVADSMGGYELVSPQSHEDILEAVDEFFLLKGKRLKVYQLKVQNKTRAMYVLGINGSYCQAYVNAVEYDEFSDHSPGEMILYAMIEQLINDGHTKFDLGVGDERYKRSWCPGKHPLFDTNIALSASAQPVILALRAKNTVKRYVRNNPKLWLKLKKIRKTKASFFK